MTSPSPATTEHLDMAQCRVLVVDDENDVRLGLRLLAQGVGAQVRDAPTAEAALETVRSWEPHVVVSDITMPGRSGLDLLEAIKRDWPHTRVVLITGYGTIEMAVTAMQRHASHFVTKPFENSVMKEAITRLGRQALLDAQIREARSKEGAGGEVVSQDPRMRAVMERVAQVAPTAMSVLIAGESGVGKELVARAIHRQSAVADRPFLALNTAALPDALLESELFGHARGAFTGAVRDRKGVFERAGGGTVFLDEIGLMSLTFQSKLLRVLQERTVVPLGASKEVPVSFRLVCATAQDLTDRMASGTFREDLYYRIHVVRIDVPPLRDRPQDIAALATHFVAKYADSVPALRARALGLARASLDTLRAHTWPGNARELENCVQRALVACQGTTILPEHLGLKGAEGQESSQEALPYDVAKQEAIRSFQRRYVENALERAGGNVTRAAETCGMTRAALQRILRALKIDRRSFEQD